jgi:hypothetical protein
MLGGTGSVNRIASWLVVGFGDGGAGMGALGAVFAEVRDPAIFLSGFR